LPWRICCAQARDARIDQQPRGHPRQARPQHRRRWMGRRAKILKEEAHLTDVIDPLGGSYYVEAR